MADAPTPTPDSKPRRKVGGMSTQQLIVWAVVTLVTAVAAAIGSWAAKPAPPPPPPQQVPVLIPLPFYGPAGPGTPSADPGVPYAQGWVSEPDTVRQIAAALPQPRFSATPAGQMVPGDMPAAVYSWKAYQILYARPPPIKNQGQVGSCVSFGTNTAVERTLACEIVRRKGSPDEWTRFVEEATYGGSRVEIGGGRINGDGSIGAWAAEFATKYGMVPRKKYDGLDLSTYSESLCRKWGKDGVPDEFEKVAREFPVKSTTQVKSWEEAKRAIAQDYLIAICSNQGFSSQRDANGVCKPQGNWSHCMCLDGYHTEGGKEWGHITNSWGTYASGPVGWGDPNPDGFWAESAVVDRMLRQDDSWAFSGVTGFPARRPLDWVVIVSPKDTWRAMATGKMLLGPFATRSASWGRSSTLPGWSLAN